MTLCAVAWAGEMKETAMVVATAVDVAPTVVVAAAAMTVVVAVAVAAVEVVVAIMIPTVVVAAVVALVDKATTAGVETTWVVEVGDLAAVAAATRSSTPLTSGTSHVAVEASVEAMEAKTQAWSQVPPPSTTTEATTAAVTVAVVVASVIAVDAEAATAIRRCTASRLEVAANSSRSHAEMATPSTLATWASAQTEMLSSLPSRT